MWRSALVVAALFFAQDPAPLEGDELRLARATVAAVAKELEEVALLHGRYEQKQESLLLAEPIVTKGRFHVRMEPRCLVLEVREPRRALVRSDATSHQVYDPAKKRAERYVFESNELAKALIACMAGDAEQLERSFVFVGAEPGDESVRLTLVPRDKRVRTVLRELRLDVRSRDHALAALAYTNAEGETVSLAFTDVVRDPEDDPDADVFDRPLPDDVELIVRRIELDEARDG